MQKPLKAFKIKATQKDFETASIWDCWEKEESEFPWKYYATETCLILKGSATIKDHTGYELRIGEGDLVTFPKGLECTWKIHFRIEKKYTFHKN